MTIFDGILKQGVRQGIVPAKSKAAREWYRTQASKLTSNVAPSRFSRGMETRKTESMELGQMYAFKYDPKMKKELPYSIRFH